MSELGKREREKAGEGISIGRSAYIRSESSSSVASSATRCSVSDTCHSVSLEITRSSILLPSFARLSVSSRFEKGCERFN